MGHLARRDEPKFGLRGKIGACGMAGERTVEDTVRDLWWLVRGRVVIVEERTCITNVSN